MNIPLSHVRRRVLASLFIVAGIAGLFWLLRETERADRPAEQTAIAAAESARPAKPGAGEVAGTNEKNNGAPKKGAVKRGNLDRRAGATAIGAAATVATEREAALAKLRARVPGVDVQFDPVTGSASHVMATGRFLTGQQDVADPVNGDFSGPVRDFIGENAALIGHGADVLQDTRITRNDVTARNGMRTVVWQQELDGVPLYNTVLKANLTRNGEVVTMGSHFISDPVAASHLQGAERAALVAQPPVNVATAVSLAAAHVGDAIAPANAQAISEPQGAERRQRMQAPGLSDTNAGLTWLPVNAGEVRLAWDVTLMSIRQNEMFRVVLDAKSGEVLMRTSLTNDISNASYRVHADATTLKPLDSPAPFSPGHVTPSSVQPAEVPRNLITLDAINTTASPNGWIDDGGTQTFGNNVDAHLDLSSTNPTFGTGTHAVSATRTFDFGMVLSGAPSTYQSAAVTTLFYLCNWYHDKMYALGFTESAGNFQQNNFGRGGLGNDAVLADAQDGSGTDNANFSTPSDGSPGRMQMYVFTGPTPDRDGDLDAEIVIHEYTHGLSNRLVGGGVGISALQPGGMGEGWSDFYGLTLLSEAGDNVNGNYAAGGYATYQLGGLTENYYYGIRRYPYSTDLTKNPLTLKDIDPTRASTHAGIPRSPIIGTTADEVHNMGEVWCVTLWEVRAGLINKHGWTIGNQLVLQIVTDGMKLAPANPTFLQARDAIVQADLVDNAGANKIEIWTAFAKRGMGASAIVPASSTATGVTESFDLPDNLGVTPASALLSLGNAGGPFSPAAQTYTLTNSGATTLNWTASKTQAWLTLSSAGGALASGGTVTVTATINSAANALADGVYADTVSFTNTSSGAVLARGITLRVGQKDYFTELFDTTANDVSNQSFLFTPNGSASFYTVARTPVTTFPTDPTGGTSLTMSDDTYAQVTPTGGITVKLYGTTYTTLYVGSNGYVTFGSGDTGYSESLFSQFALPRISALFDDLLPSTGQVTWKQTADRVAVTWQGVPEYSTSNSNSFQIEMFTDGRIRITCLGIAATDGLIGLSQGLGTPVDFLESDFSAYSSSILALAFPAVATEGDGVLTGQGTVSLSPVQAAGVTVALVSGNTAKVTVPASVTIPAGQTSATFDLTIVDNAVLDGTQAATITATAANFSAATRTISVNDNETATLAVTAPASVSEGIGTVSGTLSVSAAPAAAVAVTMASSDTAALTVPATVTIPAGQTSVNFTITIINDTKINGTHAATITASVTNWTGGSATISILDNESTNLAVSLPASVTEGGTGTGTVSISGTLTSALTVSLSSNNPSRLTVPATASIPAGSTSATFTLTATDNALTDGSATATVSATATGFTGAGSSTTVLDNDVHHFTIRTISSPQVAGVPFASLITANDLNNVTIASYTGTPALTAAGTAGAVTISPATASGFVSGVWTGNVTAGTLSNNVVLTVNDGAGHTGSSNAFNVGTGTLHHFGWSTQPVARAVGVPFSATVTAQDAGNNTVTSFNGTANLSGFAGGTGAVQVLSFIAYADTTTEYPNTKLAISASFTNYVETSTTVTDPTALAAALVGKHVFLIPEQENASSATLSALGTSWATVLNNFVTNGGVVIVCAYAAGEQGILNSAGLMNATLVGSSSSLTLTATAGTVLNTGVTTPFTGSYIDRFTSTNGTVSLQDSASGNPVVLHRDIGTGHVVLIGTDYYTTGTGMDRVVANAVAWAQVTSVPVTISPTSTGAFVNGIWTGNITAQQTASQMKLRANDGATHIGDSNAFDVTAALAISVPASAAEGSAPVTGTVSVSVAPAGALTVTLSSSDATAATVPATATISSGQTSATFPITIVDDTKINGTHPATITAARTGWTSASGTISILDNESTSLAISLPATVTEGGTGTGTVSISGTLTSALTVSLASGTTSRLTVPSTFSIPAGSTSATFILTAPDNTLADGSATVTVSASASGFTGISGTTTVLDNDAHHFTIATIASPQVRGVPFGITITAQDVSGVTVAGYTGTLALSGAGTGGALPVSPVATTAFVGGVWSGNVTVNGFDPGVVLTVNDGAGHTGTSNAFSVGTGPLHHFGWSTQPASRLVNGPFSTTVTAQDAANNTVTGFSGTANLSGFAGSGTGSSIVITEVNPNTPDEIEFMNVSTAAVDISGWQIYVYDDVSWPSPLTVFTIPAGTTCAAGQIFRLQEFGTAPGTFPQFFFGSNISWTSVSTSHVAVFLRNASGTPVDFVCAEAATASGITAPQTIPASMWNGAAVGAPLNSSDDFLRIGNSENNTSADWTTGVPGLGTVNPGLTLPFPSPTVPVSITPTVSGTFTGGVWTGNITVLQIATQMKLRADDGAAHTGDSNAFNVLTLGPLAISVPASAGEAAGTVTGTVSLPAAAGSAVTITLSSSLASRAAPPVSVIIGAGQTSITFPITITDDTLLNGTQAATITASGAGYFQATASINILDNETATLSVALPATFGASQGTVANAGVVTVSVAPTVDFTISLACSDVTALGVPASIVMAAGTTSKSFDVAIVDDGLPSGLRPVTVTAHVAGWTDGAATTVISSNDRALDWPTFGNGPAHTGYQPIRLGTVPFVPGWTLAYPSSTAGLNQAAVVSGRVFVTPNTSSGDTFMSALNAQTGTEIWRHAFASAFSINPPTAASGSVYAQRCNNTADSQLWSLDAATGVTRWSAPFGAQTEHYFAPTVVGGTVWVDGGTSGGLYGFNTAEGSQRFFNATLEPFDRWTPTFYNGTTYTWIAGKFRAHDPVTGTVLWTLTLQPGAATGTMNTVPAIDAGRAFVIGSPDFYAIDLANHGSPWSATGTFKGSPAVANNAVYVLTAANVNAYHAQTGVLLGTFATGDANISGQPIVTTDSLIVTSATATYIFDLATFSLKQTLPAGGAASLAGKVLYLAGTDGILRTFKRNASSNADLSNLALIPGTLSPIFASTTVSYTASVANAVPSVNVLPTLADPTATMTINGGSAASGLPANNVALNVGTNLIAISIAAQDGYTVNAYTVAVTRRTHYGDWAFGQGLPGANSGPADDLNGDGISNFHEWAFGTDPTQRVAGGKYLKYQGTLAGGGTIIALGLPITVIESSPFGTDTRALYVRRKDAAAMGITYTPLFSTRLSAWTPSGALPTVLADDGTYQIVSVPYPGLLPGETASFFRLKVTESP